jgi:hypothetical protein
MQRYIILAGTEKSGTTSVYQYLCAHPEIAGSLRKETDFFRSPPPHDLDAYHALFPDVQPGMMRMEASPGYLAESGLAAPAMAGLLPQARVLFILRDPIDRLLSGFDFHKSRFHIPERMLFDDYIDLCMRYEKGGIDEAQAGLKAWHLRVPDAGRYALHLRDFYAHFPAEQIKVMTLDALQSDPAAFMRNVCNWAGLDAAYYDNFAFVRANVTFSPRRAWLQKAGLRVNNALEPFFNRHPAVKQQLLGIYKRLNGRKVEKPGMTQETRQRLVAYYAEDLAELVAVAGADAADARNWLRKKYDR